MSYIEETDMLGVKSCTLCVGGLSNFYETGQPEHGFKLALPHLTDADEMGRGSRMHNANRPISGQITIHSTIRSNAFSLIEHPRRATPTMIPRFYNRHGDPVAKYSADYTDRRYGHYLGHREAMDTLIFTYFVIYLEGSRA